jgi:amino acid transporter
MKPTWAAWASGLAGLLCVGVAGREFSYYRSTHPYELEPSGEIIALAIAGAVIAFSVVALAVHIHIKDERRLQRNERYFSEQKENDA